MATHSGILPWRIPIDRGAWQATVHGVTRVGHDLVTKPPPNLERMKSAQRSEWLLNTINIQRMNSKRKNVDQRKQKGQQYLQADLKNKAQCAENQESAKLQRSGSLGSDFEVIYMNQNQTLVQILSPHLSGKSGVVQPLQIMK